MDQPIFLAKLREFGLMCSDLKTKLRSMPKLTEKADYFLDDVILPTLQDNTANLDKLLNVMEAYKDDENLKKLAGEIRTKCYTV